MRFFPFILNVQMTEHRLRAAFRRDFGVDLPISGGSGASIADAVVVNRSETRDCVPVEYAFLRLLGQGRRIDWELLQQSLVEHEGRKYDQMKIRTRWEEGDQVITQVENFYFDVTDFLT